MNQKANVIIMAGGIGSRLWPVSRNGTPKQFHDLLGWGRTLLQATFDRFVGVVDPANIWIVTNERYCDLVAEQIPEIPPKNIISEPEGKNTAPCIAYATAKIWKEDPNALMIITPSDHLVKDDDKFQTDISIALSKLASTMPPEDMIIALGIKPTRPETGFGYLQFSKERISNKIHKVKVFTEKPSHEQAKLLVKSGEFVWNTGVFVTNAATLWRAFEKHLPDVHDLFEESIPYLDTDLEKQFIASVYGRCKNISIDYAVFEKAENVFLIRSSFGWSDLGTWSSIFNHSEKNEDQNVVLNPLSKLHNSTGNLVRISGDKLAIIRGMKNFIIIDSEDVLLICPKTDEQYIKEIVNGLKLEKELNQSYL